MSPQWNADTRRGVLQSLAGASVAGIGGCLGSGGGPEQPTSGRTTDRDPPTSSRSPDCEPSPTPAAGDYPDRPEELTEQTAREFALAAERAYQRATWPGFQSLRIDTGPVASETAAGVEVKFVVWLRFRGGGDGTATPYLGDTFYLAHYLVSETGVWRAETDSSGSLESSLNPRTDGTQLICF